MVHYYVSQIWCMKQNVNILKLAESTIVHAPWIDKRGDIVAGPSFIENIPSILEQEQSLLISSDWYSLVILNTGLSRRLPVN